MFEEERLEVKRGETRDIGISLRETSIVRRSEAIVKHQDMSMAFFLQL